MIEDIIYLHNLKTRSLIGILPHERVSKQTLIISCELGTDIRAASKNDDIAKTINYARVAEFIEEFSENSTFALLETFAETLATALLTNFPAKSVQLDIQKPAALIQTQEVGLRIFRQA